MIYKEVVSRAVSEDNSLAFLLAYYSSRKSQYKVLFDVLNNHLSGHSSDKITIEEKAYRILCHEIVSSSVSEKLGQELMEVIQDFRETNEHSKLV